MRSVKFSSLFLCSTLFINCSAGPLFGGQNRKIVRTGLVDVSTAAEMVETDLDNTDPAQQPDMLLMAGEYRRLNGDYKVARSWFTQILEEHDSSLHKNAATLGVAIIDFESGKSQSLDTIRTASEDNVPDSLNADRFRILFLSEMDKDGALAQRYKAKAESYATSHPITQEHFERDIRIGSVQESPESPTVTEEPEVKLSEAELMENMKVALEAKDWGMVIAGADKFFADFPESNHTFLVQAYKDRATAQEPFVNNRIAVFLPLSGKYGPAAKAIQNSIQFALGEDSTIEVKYYDTGWEAIKPLSFKDPKEPTEEELVAQAKWEENHAALMESVAQNSRDLVKKAVIEDGCGLLVGPLLMDVAPSVAEAAAAYEIPMLSLSNSNNITEMGDGIHQVSVGLQQQIDALISHAMDVKGWTTFAAMIPDTDGGAEAFEVFKQTVEAKGGTVVRHVVYPENTSSFVRIARDLGRKLEDRPSSTERRKNPTIDHPIIDFDALFLPDNHRKAPLITAALASEGFSVGGFHLHRHAKPVGILGLNKWNHPTIVKNGGQYMKNAIFVDAFWSKATDETTEEFVKSFKTEFKKKPNIINAVVYDAMQIGKQLYSTPQTSRQSIQQGLHDTQFSNLVTGAVQFDDRKVLDRDLHIIVVKSTRLEVWVPPKEDDK